MADKSHCDTAGFNLVYIFSLLRATPTTFIKLISNLEGKCIWIDVGMK